MQTLPSEPIHPPMNDDDDDVATVTSELSYDDVMLMRDPREDLRTHVSYVPYVPNRGDFATTTNVTDVLGFTTEVSRRRERYVPPVPLVDWYYDVKLPKKLYYELNPLETPCNAPITCKKKKHKSTNLHKKVVPVVDLSKAEKYEHQPDSKGYECGRTSEENAELERILQEQLIENLRDDLMGETTRRSPHVSYTTRLSRGWHTFQDQTLGFLKKMIA